MEKHIWNTPTRAWRSKWEYISIIAIFCLIAADTARAQECSSPTFDFSRSSIVGDEISAQQVNVAIATHNVSNVKTVVISALAGSKLYINAVLNSQAQQLVISTTQEFENFLQTETIPTLYSQLQFTCDSGSTKNIRLQVPIREENLYTPTFSQVEYRIELPLPLPKNFDLTQYIDGGNGIRAYDYDLFGNEVSFTLDDNPYFHVEQQRGSTDKEFIARLTTANTLTRIENGLILKIIGTDAGTPPKSGTAQLNISGDPFIRYTEPPQFQQSLHETTHKTAETFVPIEVNLQANTYDETVTFRLSGEDAELFAVAPKSDRSGATITLRPGVFIPAAKSFASAVVTANRTGAELEGRTALVVKIEPELPPAFEQSVYVGSVSKGGVVSVDGEITLVSETASGEITIELTEPDAQYFSVVRSGNVIRLRASDELTEEVLDNRFYFHLALEASKIDVGSGMAFVVLEVLKEDVTAPRFEKLFYEGSVTEEAVGVIPAVKVTDDSYVEGLSFAYTGDHAMFTIAVERNVITFTPKGITEEMLKGRQYLLVGVSASLKDRTVSETIVIVKILRQDIITPRFVANFLQGQLDERTHNLTAIKVVLDPGTVSTDTTINLQDSNGIFELNKTTLAHEFVLGLRNGVTLPDESHITVIVESSNPKSPTASCFILVEVLRVPLVAPQFEQLLYEGLIDSSNQLQELRLKLKQETYDETVTFSLFDDDADLFTLQRLVDNEVAIRLKNTTTEEDFIGRESLRFNVRAAKSNGLNTVVPVVVFIEKVDVMIPKFEKPLYTSRIGTDLQLVPFETIELVEGLTEYGLEMSVLLNNTDLFAVDFANDMKVSVSLKKQLTADDLEGFERFEFVIEVRNPSVGSGYATILIDIIREAIVFPEFTATFYSGTINEVSQVMTFPEKIVLKEATITDGVNYHLSGEDASLVSMEVNKDLSLKFSLKDEVTVELLKNKHQLNFLIQATNPGSNPSSASIAVTIIRPIEPAFTKSSFYGLLKEGQSTVDFDSDIINLLEGTFLNDTSFTVAGEDSALFNVFVSEEKIIQISLKPTLSWDQIRYRSYLRLFLVATNPGAASASCTIIISVVNNPVPTATFTKAFYRGFLRKGDLVVTFDAPEVITLDPTTVTATLTFKVSENDHSLFNVTRNDNKFQVSLNSSVTEEDIEGRDMLSFLIEANNKYGPTDMATIIVSVQQDEFISPAFMEAIYHGSIKENSTELIIPSEITFRPGTATNNTEVGVTAGDSDWFTAVITDAKVLITVKTVDSIDWDKISDRKQLSFVLQATNPGSVAASTFILLEIKRLIPVVPRFKKTSFRGYLEVNSRVVQFSANETIELEQGTVLPGFTLELLDYDHEFFTAAMENNRIDISLNETVTEDDLADRQYLALSVAVANPNGESVTAAVVIDVIRDTTPVKVPAFEKSTYNGTIGDDFRLRLHETIMITEDTFTENIEFSISESNSDLFAVTASGRQAVVQLTKNISAEDLQPYSNLYITIEALSGQNTKGSCFLVVSLPVEEHEICTPTPPVIECTECYNCSTGEPLDDAPVFAYGNYRFNLKSDTVGVIGVVRASVKDPTVVLEHRIVTNDDYLNINVGISTDGILHISNALLPKQYTFLVIALNPQSGKQSTANVTLDVFQDPECPANPEDPKLTTVEQLLVIEHLLEETPHPNIFPSQLANCEYELIDEKPYQEYNYFEINPDTHWLSSRRFDRENTTLFQGMTIPQFQLRLRLICADQPEHSLISKRALIETENLHYARDITVMNVIVADINDNDPYFVNPPAGQEFHIGFPNPSVAAKLMMPELITVLAEDLDEGLNAKIRYSLNTNEHFDINPEQGSIYPLKDALKSSSVVRLTVKATDRDGAADGRSSDITLNVHRLEDDQLVLLTVMGEEDAENVVDQVNAKSNGVQLRPLVHARVPSTDQTSIDEALLARSRENTVLRILVYAFNEQNELQRSNTIESIIRSSPLSESIATDSYNNAVCSDITCERHDRLDSANTGLIAASSVLGVLFLISAAVAVFLYLRFIRPLNATSADSSDVVQLENDFEISPPPSPPTGGAKKLDDGTDPDDRRISIQISGITEQESEDSKIPVHRLARSLDDRLERVDENGLVPPKVALGSPTDAEPKNVKFNELVERIEVVEHHPDEEEFENEFVYNERL